MPEFVILYHEFPASSPRKSHWDLMLRDGDVLLTWALEADPLVHSSSRGERLDDHRLEYVTYQGEVGGGRGTVTRVASGDYRWLVPLGSAKPGTAELGTAKWQVELNLSTGRTIKVSCHNDQHFEFESDSC